MSTVILWILSTGLALFAVAELVLPLRGSASRSDDDEPITADPERGRQ